MELEFRYETDPAEAPMLTVRGNQQVRIPLGHRTERLNSLTETARFLASRTEDEGPRGNAEELLVWRGDRWQYRMELLRRNWDELTLNLYYSPDRLVEKDARHHLVNERQVLHWQGATSEFLGAIIAELERLLIHYGFVGFRKSHSRGEIPISGYFTLLKHLRNRDAGLPHGESSLDAELTRLRELLGEQGEEQPAVSAYPHDHGAAADEHPASPGEEFELEYHLLDAGWAKARVKAGGREITFQAGYLTHCLAELSRAAWRLLLPDEPLRRYEEELPSVRWEGEPDRLRWQFIPSGPHEVEVSIYYCPDACKGNRDFWGNPAEEKLALRFRCPVREFARRVVDQLERTLRKHGLRGYRENWIYDEFPITDYLVLRRLLNSPPLPPAVGGLAAEVGMLEELLRR